ncbi:metal ABC transporter permease [Albimonas pacifica]|uniref:Manganese/zinc/iron transport system permease protein n=1 Tax=Albimonas pacifica TaxID=1114924 RepID=A0A1I3K9W4_9RHOB|nr:metal ABC transporter permease [Albimonas pacifica]SFI69088.1 manganese/zinc/iron transport system permease protein [Albimonas pacifica]
MEALAALVAALTLQAGWNASLVALGAGMLGLAAGGAGAFLFLRKRALVSDAASHATLPGVAAAFLVMVAFGGDGRFLPGLMLGSAISAGLGLALVAWITRATRLAEDAAIGAVLSVSFGLGIVLLTVIQIVPAGKAAGLEGFLLGSTAGMLQSEAVTIAVAGAIAAALVFALRRPMTLVAFDPEHAEATGVGVWRTDLAMMGVALLVTVVGLKIVGLVLIVALLIIPPVAARFWTDRVSTLALLATAFGGVAGYVGAAISSIEARLPTGPIIVLAAFAIFAVSFLVSPRRGVLAALLRRRRLEARVHLRQGLLALARGEAVYDRLTLRLLLARGWIRRDGAMTEAGRAAAAAAALDEARWSLARRLLPEAGVAERYDGLTPIGESLTPDQIARIDRGLARPEALA